ncbi:hypothetical protein GCM10022382_29000 [Microbacterium invictum]
MQVAADRAARDGWERHLELFTGERRRLFGIAYRMLRSVADADDIVQEAWIKWQRVDLEPLRDPVAFLVTITTRLCLNLVQSAYRRREVTAEPWLPDQTASPHDPAHDVEIADQLRAAVDLLVTRLTPAERAAFVLRETLDYPYARIATLIGASQAGARQLVSRARRQLTSPTRRDIVTGDPRPLLVALRDASRGAGTERLEALVVDAIPRTSAAGHRPSRPAHAIRSAREDSPSFA